MVATITRQESTRTSFKGSFNSEYAPLPENLRAPATRIANTAPATTSKPRRSFLDALLKALSAFAV